ncbi:MAG: tetratricopeptide repeat protein [Candidatus Kapabacteria bacterium]|nr:tetratricopeptide repeat protein [Candidatus Kapabacteria bacterium]
MHPFIRFVALGITFAWFAISVFAQADSSLKSSANTAFQQHRWQDAARAYEIILKTENTNPMAWFRLGTSLHNLGKYKQAVKPYQEAIQHGFQNTTATFRLARVYAVLGHSYKALNELERAVKLGFATTIQGFDIEPDFDNIRKHPRFVEITAAAQARVCAVCDAQVEYHQLDFWLGQWDVRPYSAPNALPIARSVVERANGHCTIVENYYTKAAYTGKSFNSYDASTKKWRQFWNDNFGQILQFEGEFDAKENALKYRSESRNNQGQRILNRMTFYNLSPNTVRQVWETSADDGLTWVSAFDGIYTRRI